MTNNKKIPKPTKELWDQAYYLLNKQIDKNAKEGRQRQNIIGSVADLVSAKCEDCGGVLIRVEYESLLTNDKAFMSGLVACPSQNSVKNHKKNIWLEVWYWPTGKKYLDFMESLQGPRTCDEYEGKYGVNPFKDLFVHSDPKIPICYEINELHAIPGTALFKLEGHDFAFGRPSYLHKPADIAGVIPRPDLNEDERKVAELILKDISPK